MLILILFISFFLVPIMEKTSNQVDSRGSDEHYDNEKHARHDNDVSVDEAILSEFTKDEQRSIIHRIDRRLVLVCS